MAAREIPGYYYGILSLSPLLLNAPSSHKAVTNPHPPTDAAKNKYFKIAKTHTVPTNSPYSAETIKKRKADDEAQRQKRRLATSNAGRIKRAAALRNPLLGGAILRESGSNWDPTTARKAYTEGWRATEVLASIPRGWDGTRFTEREPDMCAFDVDLETGMLLFGAYARDSVQVEGGWGGRG